MVYMHYQFSLSGAFSIAQAQCNTTTDREIFQKRTFNKGRFNFYANIALAHG